MKICDACRSEIGDEIKVCPYCGFEFPEEENVQEPLVTQPTEEIPVPKATKSGSSRGIITIAVVAIVVLISVWGGRLLGGSFESAGIEDIQEYIDKISVYTYGKTADGVYISEFWNISADFSDGWILSDEEELRAATEDLYATQLETAREGAEEIGSGSDFAEKYMESVFANVEFSAVLDSDEKIAVCVFQTSGVYGADELTKSDLCDIIAEDYTGKTTTVKIGGTEFEGTQYDEYYGDMLFTNRVFISLMDGLIGTMHLAYTSDAEAEADYLLNTLITELD